MDVDRFVRERRHGWQRLQSLLEAAEAAPDHELGTARLQELVRLYRQACSDLNQARSYTASPDLLGRLNDLTGRGYRFVYRRQHGRRMRDAVRVFLEHQMPAAFRKERAAVLVAALTFALGATLGFTAVSLDRDNAARLIPAAFFTESPKERVAQIEKDEERVDSLEKASRFGAYLYTHNIEVAFLTFSLGALTIVGGVWLLFYNGVILGAVAASYVLEGVQVFFLAWVGPHGALELPAIVFAGAAGLRAGRALLMPGDLTAGAALREALPTVWRMMMGTALVLVAAGLVEGSFSQFSARTFPYAVKIAVAAALFAALVSFLFLRRLPEEPPA